MICCPLREQDRQQSTAPGNQPLHRWPDPLTRQSCDVESSRRQHCDAASRAKICRARRRGRYRSLAWRSGAGRGAPLPLEPSAAPHRALARAHTVQPAEVERSVAACHPSVETAAVARLPAAIAKWQSSAGRLLRLGGDTCVPRPHQQSRESVHTATTATKALLNRRDWAAWQPPLAAATNPLNATSASDSAW